MYPGPIKVEGSQSPAAEFREVSVVLLPTLSSSGDNYEGNHAKHPGEREP